MRFPGFGLGEATNKSIFVEIAEQHISTTKYDHRSELDENAETPKGLDWVCDRPTPTLRELHRPDSPNEDWSACTWIVVTGIPQVAYEF